MPVPTGDLEAAFQATGAPNIIACSAAADPTGHNPQAPGQAAAGAQPGFRSCRAR